MKIQFSLIILLMTIFLSCDNRRKRECFLEYGPSIALVEYDTSKLDSFVYETYKAQNGFDSLLETTLRQKDSNFYSSTNLDTIFLISLGQTTFNWKIKFADSSEIWVSTLKFNSEVCYDLKAMQGCYCSLNSYKVETKNCKYVVSADLSTIYISE